jgi:hypothetical protein
MAMLSIRSFGGIVPKVPARFLPETKAQTALNTSVFTGSLKPLANVGATLLTLSKVGTPKTIYRFGQDTISDTQYWFEWITDVNVCRSQISGDTSEWTFFTGDGAPKATYNSLALSSPPYPAASRPLGLKKPSAAVTVAATGTPDPQPSIETRVYTFTWVNKESGFEFESAPAPPSLPVDVSTGETVDITDFPAAPSGYVVTHKRIYRATAGVFLFVAEITAATASYNDAILAENLGEELPSLTWEEPPTGLSGLTNLPNGNMAGFVGRDIYFCEPYRPFAWPLQYIQSIDFPVVGLGRLDTTLVVLTTGTPYFIQGTSPESMVVVKSDLEQACASKRSIVSFNGIVMYASPDGLVALTPGGSKLVTQDYFTKEQWQAFKPDSIHAYQTDLKYVAFYDTGSVQGGFIYDTASGEFITHNVYATAGYTDIQRDKLFLAFSDRTVKVWEGGSALTYTWKSKKFTVPYPISFSTAQVQAETYPLTAKFYRDGVLMHTQTVASRGPFRLPALMGLDWEVQLEGTSEVFAVEIAQSPAELASV